jgi:ribosomal protein L10
MALIHIPTVSTVMRTHIGEQPCSIRIVRYTIPTGVAMVSEPADGPHTSITKGPHTYYFSNMDLGKARNLLPVSQRTQSISKQFKQMVKEIVPLAAAAFD